MLKELRETLRDTRTVGTLFLMPLLVYPLISLLMQNFIPRDIDPETTAKFQIGLDSTSTLEYLRDRIGSADDSIRQEQFLLNQTAGHDADHLLEAVEPEQLAVNQQDWSVMEGVQDYRKFVSEGTMDLVLRLRQPTAGEPGGEPVLEMYFDHSREFSRAAAAYIALRVERYNLMQAHTTMARVRLPSSGMLARLEIPVAPVITSAVSFATLIPLILIMMTITGAVYPAIDLTAGERERGTLESLMAAPVPRVGILAAKYVAVWTVAMLTASLNVISMLVTLWVMRLDTVFLGADGITVSMVVPMFALLGLFAFFFSAILLVVTSAARSFKEAQAYLIPLMMLSLTPGALALMPNIQAELWMAFVPMVNLVLLSRDVMLGAVVADFAWLSIVSTLLYSVVALSMAARVFGSDAVLYGSEGSWRELFQKERTQQVPSPAFALLVLAILFPTQFVMLGVLSRMQPQSTAIFLVGMMSLFTMALFLLLPVAAVLARGFAVVPTFALQLPTWSAALGGALLGIGLWPLVGLSLWGLSQWRAWMLGTEATAWSNQVVQLALQQTSGWAELPIGLLVLCLAIVPAVCEEWFFRGLLLQSLRRKNPVWAAILWSGIAFGLFHFVVESSVAPLRFFVTATLGMVLAWVCIRSGSLWPGILLHAINNGILTTLALSRESLQASPPNGTVVAIVLGGCLLALLAGVWILARVKPLSARTATAGLLGIACLSQASAAQAQEVVLPKTGAGFVVRQFAADSLAHDIHCLAIGPNDEVFVSGPGYLRQLIDTNADGTADQGVPASFQPRQGAQGLLIEPEWLWVAADQAIWRVPRAPGAKASKWIELPKTGGEHDFHSLRRGADGWLYFLAGNHAQIDQSFISSPVPIAQPQAGVIGRISPDGQIRQVLVHGMRNAYGFDFDLDGSFLVYDSDDERDAGLPWYRPTTLFSAAEGADIGWVSRCYKKPAGTLGSASIRAETGRGSPTGVAVQRSSAWGISDFGGVAFADWTFGRVYWQRRGQRHSQEAPLVLLESQANAAFAPTSLAFDRRGRLWIATGGRNTSGAVYVVERAEPPAPEQSGNAASDLADWFARFDSAGLIAGLTERSQVPTTAVGNSFATEHAELMAAIQTLESGSTLQERQDWLAAGQRLLVRNLILCQPQAWRSAERREELRQRVADVSASLWPDAVIWLAMAGTSLSDRDLEFSTFGPRQLVAWSTRDDDFLWKRMRESGPNENNRSVKPDIDEPAEAIPPNWVAVQALVALAHRNATLQLSAEQQSQVAERFAFELQEAAAGRPGPVSWADWLLVWRWALRSPVLGDGQTGPWDFMRRQVELTADESLRQRLEQSLQATWHSLSSGPSSGQGLTRERLRSERPPAQPRSTTLAAESAVESATPSATPSAESWQRLLEIQLLLGLDPESLPVRWQSWFELQQRDALVHRAPAEGWHPIARTQAMVLLAAMPPPWPDSATEVVADYLLNVDQRLKAWGVSTDRNWDQRFEELGRLLCSEHPGLQQRLVESTEWQRSAQVPLLAFLSHAQQPSVVAKLLSAAKDWEPRSLESGTLDLLAATVDLWQLQTGRSSETNDLAARVHAWIATTRAAQDQFFTQQQPALTDSELSEALRQLETNVSWETGDPQRGKLVYQRRNCQLCHGQNGRLGPALSGVTRRFQRREVLTVVLQPDSRISDRYQPLWIEKTDGTLLIGRPIYESSDGVLLEDQQGRTWQLSRAEIEWSRPAPRSLMPTGLMTDASEQDWADLLAFLATQ